MNLKLVTIFCTLIICIIFTGCFNKKIDLEEKVINVYNWGEYISDGSDNTLNANEEFTKRTGIKVNYTTFQDNESLFAKLSNGGTNYDIVVPSDYMVAKMIKKNMLKKINFENIPNFSLIKDDFKFPEYDPTNEYSIPYTYGLIGLFYNKKIIDEKEQDINWNILWNEKYRSKILMFDNSRDAFAIAQIKLGLSVNSENTNDWVLASDELKKQRPLVQSYVMDQIFDKMRNNEAAVAPYYDGDAQNLLKSNSNIGFTVPKEGTVKFVDAMCIPVNSLHQKEAEEYINFMCEYEISKANISKTGYSSPEETTDRSLDLKTQTFSCLSDDVNILLDDLWVEVKTGESGNYLFLILIIFIFILFYFGILFYKKQKNK